jgi:hypothetical protein
MTPIRYLLVFVLLLVAFCAVCYGIGEFFVQLILPKTQYIEYTDWATTFFFGVLGMFFLFTVGASLSMLSIFVRVNILGVGTRTVPE